MVSPQPEPIAIVGSGCRFPGNSNSSSDLWKLLQSPRDVSKAISQTDRFDPTGYYHPDGSHHATTNVRQAYLLEDDLMKDFDASFFNISPSESDSIDPQQRLLLEAVYEALEFGGHTIEALRGSDTAVFVGCMGVDWNDLLLRDPNTLPTYFATGTNRAIISNRVSYCFDWHGPSMTIDTACSSSLIAVHQGVQTLRSGESRIAVACGTNVILGPDAFVFESKMKMLSPTGRSRMWDADADGYARGEGVAAVILKRLSDAIADGDHIECLIRETGANQDGHSAGITVPSTQAQAALIRKTYAKAGLDPENNVLDRPQFFEAHGTGTKAGDPKEAAAIADCFGSRGGDPLYVGSVKTVIGHTEGAAGLAGVFKASCMIQNGVIPPNLLFNRLNPDIEKHYQGLKVPTSPIPWPELPEGVPRRVSVNSFGFGGSNAHAILEEYRSSETGGPKTAGERDQPPFLPFVFSAASETSLRYLLERYSDFLKNNSDINALDLCWTLRSRRSQLATKIAFSALNIRDLTDKIDERLAQAKQSADITLGIRTKTPAAVPLILGVFTGQGAQWATMGAALIQSSHFVRERLKELEDALSTLPHSDRPSWSLLHEILVCANESRIAEAEISQPLCTAIQVILVDLLHAAGITFQAVVGHSSGEIAAAYAAGFLSAHDAIRIAYYRGFHTAHLAGNKQRGAMLAVGTSWEDAQDLVNLRAFRGRLQVAAHNSPASVTLSGDADAVIHAKKVFDEEKKFARLLKVDTAYHSHHMLPCGDAYVESMRKCGIKINMARSNSTTWFSSVFADKEMGSSEAEILRDVYWRDNMSNPVLFAEALKAAVGSDDRLNLVIEVGPHPALKGPATDTISEVRSTGMPYTGVLNRGKNDIESFSNALGFIWMHFGTAGVDFESFHQAVETDVAKQKLLVGLPSYAWHHGRTYWYESRKSKQIRMRKEPFHEILGIPCPDSTDHDRRWQNVLKLSEIPWLSGHQLQGQTVFPAAGYCAMAFEAAKSVANGRAVEFFELSDLAIPKAITFEEDVNFSVETLVTLTSITESESTMSGVFSCYSVSTLGSELDMELMSSGNVKIVFGTSSPTTLPSIPLEDYNMTPVDTEKFYSNLLQLGYGYTGGFRTMTEQKRRLNQASALVSTYAYTDADCSVYLVHPTMLDVAFQATMLAFSAPGDDRLWSLHVPTGIGKIRINPELCASLPISTSTKLPTSVMVDRNCEANAIRSSVDVFYPGAQQTLIQVEDLTMKPFAPATAADDRRLFAMTKWNYDTPNGASIVGDVRASKEDIELATLCERLSYAYLRSWKSDLTDEEWANSPSYFHQLKDFMDYNLVTASRGEHASLKKEWADDSLDDVKALISALGYAETVDIRLLSAVSSNIPAAVRGETTILEHMVVDDMLEVFYKKGLGFERYNSFLADAAQQITHRYPRAKILEIGAGTGGATKTILDKIGKTVSSYTYTDISVGFFEQAAKLFKNYSDKIIFKPFDVEKPPASQGFEEHTYDLVIASNVLHATASIQRTLEHARQLLKPGGYIVMLELTNNGPIRSTNIMGGLPGWWVGKQDGREGAPTISPGKWHAALRKSGFSGVDMITPELDTLPWPFSIIVSQAVDDRVSFLRRPLTVSPASSSFKTSIHLSQVVILGARSLKTARISEELSELLGKICDSVTILDDLPTEKEAQSLTLNSMETVFVNLVDLDTPIFRAMTEERIAGLKRVFELGKHILWVTSGAQGDEPYSMASIAFSRVISHEARHISLNHLDVSDLEHDISRNIAEHLVRQYVLEEWDHEKHTFLWSKEPEAYLAHGQLKLPRVILNDDMNDRLNSSKRTITKSVLASNSTVAVFADSPTSIHVVEDVLPVAHKGDLLVKLERSSVMALGVTANTFLFLGIGRPVANGEDADALITLSATNSSPTSPIASVPVAADLAQQVGGDDLLVAVAAELLAASLLQSLPTGSSLLAHVSAEHRILTAALTRQAAARSVHVRFICGSECSGVQDPTWIKLDARAPKHVVRRALLPLKLTHFIDLEPHRSEGGLSMNIAHGLPATCKRLDASDLYRFESLMRLPHSCGHDDLASILNEAVSKVKKNAAGNPSQSNDDLIIHVGNLDAHTRCTATSVVHWPLNGKIEVEVRPLDAKRLFSQDKTYILFGLTGEIGQSLTDWMTQNGAGCVILTSRNPKVDERWLKSFEETTATVKVVSLDITDYNSLERVVKDIKATCPPIAGVANGAMVLHDSLFADMNLHQMTEVLRPKIDGSKNLDTLFHDDDLDFFIMFSSSTCVIGNSGQSNYAAANGYLNALARQRRKRGLAASAFDIGRVAGLGYAEAAGLAVIEHLTRIGMLPISATDFHTMCAETIRAGYVYSEDLEGEDERAVVTTGIRQVYDDDVHGPWFRSPRFSHFILESQGAESDAQMQDRKTSLPVSKQLANAASMEHALEVLKECFAAKLRVILQSSDEEIDHDASLVELGVDSLVAVEVRSWFLKELKVDVPVLKVVGGSSIADISQLVLGKLPEELAASIGTGRADENRKLPKKPISSSNDGKPSGPAVMQPDTRFSTSKDTTSGLSSQRSSSPSNDPSSNEGSPASSLTPLPTRTPSSEDLFSSAKQGTPQTFVRTEQISFGQSRFWFLRLLLQDQTTFNVTFYYKVTGTIRVGDLERAIRAVANRHEALRTCFVADPDPSQADIGYQKVLASSPMRLEYKRISSIEDVSAEYASMKAHVFDIENGEVMRVILLTLSPTSHYMLISYHHIMMDGVSLQVFMADLEKEYKDQSLALSALPLQFPDFSRTQRAAFENGDMNNELEFWRGVFPDEPPVLPLLPMAQSSSRLPMKSFDVHQVESRMDAALAARIRSVARAQRSTPFHFYLAAFKVMIFLFTDIQDLTIGIADANRNDSDVMGTIGFFLNLLTLRFRRVSDQCFADAITEARNTTYAALSNSRLPFDVLLKELNVPRSSSYSPFFQAFFDYRQGAQEKHQFDNALFEVQEFHPGRTAYDLTLDVTENATDAFVAFRTQKSLYDLTAASLLLETYISLIDTLSMDVSMPLNSTPLFGQKQLADAVKIGKGPDLVCDWPSTLPHRIDQIAKQHQGAVALMDGFDCTLTYTEMTSRIEAIAEALQRDVQAGIGSRVLVFQQPAADWVCSMLAIMRIGAVYVPLDLRNPLPRLAAVASDCEATAVLADRTTINDTAELLAGVPQAKVIDVSQVPTKSSVHVPNIAQAESPAAILYTSGSTGLPKGIIVTHAGLRNEIMGYTKTWNLGAERVLQQSAFTFNHSSDQIYTGLVNGGMVYIVPWNKRGDPLEITKLLQQHGITYTKATPSEYSLWMQYGGETLRKASSWRFAFGGGEPFSTTVMDEFAQLELSQLRVFNSYGPTEISISSHKMEVAYCDAKWKNAITRIPCGFSLPNYTTYILDENLKPLPIGMPGEVVIGGAGVSLGYLNNKELTEKHFVANPYASREYIENGWTRMYRTGDIGHLQKDGAMVFHNRIAGDTQTKIRGLRIELGDIESNLLVAARGLLREAVVTVRQGNGGDEFLVAHVVFTSKGKHEITDQEVFLEHLLSNLPVPQYMVPVLAIPVEKLPLTNHSKVDRKAISSLPLPQRATSTGHIEQEGEMTETMIQLKHIWQDVLANKEFAFDISPSTSFFLIGGNSLLAIRLQSRIRQVFNVTVRLVELLGANKLSEMARKIDESMSVELIDWEKETALPSIPMSLSDAAGFQSKPKTSKNTVLVTGGTGYLAKYILPQLMARADIDTIHLVAIRDLRKLAIAVSPNVNVIPHTGDLSLPLLGLSEDEFVALARNVDLILHMGAVRSFWDNYHVLRPANVHPTRELVKLAAPRRIPIHYISSAGVLSAGASTYTNLDFASSAEAHIPSADGSNGYVASRWASERILEKAAEHFGLNVTINRFVPSSSAMSEASLAEIGKEFIRFVDLSQAMPDFERWSGRVDIVDAEQAARWVCEAMDSSLEKSNAAPGSLINGRSTFRHCESSIAVDVAQLTTLLEHARGNKGMEKVNGLKWIGRIKALGFGYFFSGQEVALQEGSSGARFESRR